MGRGGGVAVVDSTFTGNRCDASGPDVDLAGSVVRHNTANEGGGGIFFVSNDRTGELRITSSVLERDTSLGLETAGYPGILFLGLGAPQVTDSVIR